MYRSNVFIIILFTLELNLFFCKETYKTNLDFLIHESGGITDAKRNYETQFPSLNPPSKSQNQHNINAHTTVTTSVGTTSKPSNPKRDYVAPNFPTLKPPIPPSNPTSSISTSNTNIITTPKIPSAPKRDYVAPQFTTSKPKIENNQSAGGKVKDLINIYDNKDKNQGLPVPTQKPSYSSVVHDPKATQGSTLSTSTQFTTKPTQGTHNITPKPISFSDIVSGSNKPNTKPMQKPELPNSNSGKPVRNNGVNPVATSRPSSPVLPSSVVNTNTNNNKNGPSNVELQKISEELLKKDVNNAAKYVTINYQEKTTSFVKEDKAPQPLLTIAPEAWNIPTIQKFLPLLDNYERDTLVNEHVTPQERNEENAFIDAVLATSVMRHLMNFLKEKGFVTQDPKQQRDFFKQIWFGLYSRGKGKISSSGFEHIFVSELKNGEVSGLHNWIYFSKEEAANRINYLGYLKYAQMSDKGAVLKQHFIQQGVDKPVDSMFIGTSPELEMAAYTLCYVARPDAECKLKFGNQEVDIITHNYRYRSKNYIGSAYPQI